MKPIDKDISPSMGQYMTPAAIVDFCLDKITIDCNYVIEPSCGSGNFLKALRQKAPQVLGIEVDEKLAGSEVRIANFYDFSDKLEGDVAFIGNPPWRNPAHSLTSHPECIKSLAKKYGLIGIKEEAVFFLAKTIDVILENKVSGSIHYILPKSIFQNNSKAYASFHSFLKKYVQITHVWDIQDFPNVNQQVVFMSMKVPGQQESILLNDKECTDFYGNQTDYIPFQQIFKKTYLGSVPCENIFMSIVDESLENFRDRLVKLFSDYQPELLRNFKNEKKAAKILEYIEETKSFFDCSLFADLEYYKPIRHRHEDRFYFRHDGLKKAKFIYILNSNPCPSFYFPGNPSSNSTDYFGICPYDVNRNSGPGANRCVPILGLEENLHDDFKEYWKLPYDKIFEYILHISKSEWYKAMKKTYHRFYFGIPREFDKSFAK